MLYETVRPDRSHLKVSAGGMVVVETIRIGSDAYIFREGRWEKTTGSGQADMFQFNPDQYMNEMNQGIEKGNTVKKGGVSTVDGTACQEWVVTGATPNESGTLCIGVSDHLPRLFKSADSKTTMTFSDWNGPITINPPN